MAARSIPFCAMTKMMPASGVDAARALVDLDRVQLLIGTVALA
jgi:hypothetical protein